MHSYRCSKENCLNKLFAKCDCEGELLFCSTHIHEHLLTSKLKNHHISQMSFKPSDEIKQPVIQKLTELRKDIKIYRKRTILEASDVIKNFKTALEKSMDKLVEIDKRCNRVIEILNSEEEVLDYANENEMESVLKLNAQQANFKMIGWSINNCHTDYKAINVAINEAFKISFDPFVVIVENHIVTNELSFFIHNSSDFTTINLDNFQISSTITLPTQETIHANSSKCILPDETQFYCCNVTSNSGITFTVDKNKNVKQLQKSNISNYLEPVFFNNFIFFLGGQNNLAERYNFTKNVWENVAPLPQGLNFAGSKSILFEDFILIIGYHINKMIIYSITQNHYKDALKLEFAPNTWKLLLSGNHRIYAIEKGGRIFESAENNIESWENIGNNDMPNNAYQIQSVVVRYKNSLYFVLHYNELWKFDLALKKLYKVATV